MSDADDRLQIHELINLHGHLMDEGEFDRLDELLVDEVVYDVSALGGGLLIGARAVADAGRALGDANPLAHHVTNVVVTELNSDTARARSKGLAVLIDGGNASVVYDDEFASDGARVANRIAARAAQARSPSAICRNGSTMSRLGGRPAAGRRALSLTPGGGDV